MKLDTCDAPMVKKEVVVRRLKGLAFWISRSLLVSRIRALNMYYVVITTSQCHVK